MKSVSGKDLGKALERNGWTLMHIRGSHHRYEKPGVPPIIVPVHGNRSLKTGLQRAIMRQAGLDESDL